MPRPPRIEYENAWYHVMNRGAAKMTCFNSGYHRQLFLSLLAESCKTHNSELHAYCLMDNHYHLIIRTPGANLAGTMHDATCQYVKLFNLSEDRDGPLFRSRYTAKSIESYSYLLHASRYIHLNPVEAGLVNKPEEYAWSSHKFYLALSKQPNWLHTNTILSLVSLNEDNIELTDRAKYQEYINQEIN